MRATRRASTSPCTAAVAHAARRLAAAAPLILDVFCRAGSARYVLNRVCCRRLALRSTRSGMCRKGEGGRRLRHASAAAYKWSHTALQMSSSSATREKRQGSILPFLLAQSAGQTRHSAGETRSADSPCVFCIYACTPCEPDTTMMGALEHATVLDSVLRFWSHNAATTEPVTLSVQCAELAASLQASSTSCRGAESEDLAPDGAAIDAEMVLEHMTRHRCDEEGQLAMLRQALFTACASERVLTRTMFVRGKGGKLQLDAATAQQHRVVTGTMVSLVGAIAKLSRP